MGPGWHKYSCRYMRPPHFCPNKNWLFNFPCAQCLVSDSWFFIFNTNKSRHLVEGRTW
ncbi:hypothetical protein B0O99DRAFT_623243 [Bisporella sp. PMI_857]|nr:hypothetical protein B0O99DRAFT_623243 [Bisporella sp. PMI_857]